MRAARASSMRSSINARSIAQAPALIPGIRGMIDAIIASCDIPHRPGIDPIKVCEGLRIVDEHTEIDYNVGMMINQTTKGAS